MTSEALPPESNPSIYSPEKAAEWLRNSGVPDEIWPHIAEFGLHNHWNRTLVDIALGEQTVDVNQRFEELFGDEPHGPKRIENLHENLIKNIKKD